eukprot:GEMP01059444.1.p1 GENE.GEMP01059444.1~~GEMP01059444.1.p1  ORF type:complete len:117 (-),score=6.13 GEMP01059444.1:231-581(-)
MPVFASSPPSTKLYFLIHPTHKYAVLKVTGRPVDSGVRITGPHFCLNPTHEMPVSRVISPHHQDAFWGHPTHKCTVSFVFFVFFSVGYGFRAFGGFALCFLCFKRSLLSGGAKKKL